jgi:predicted nucleic acid-binding protein
VSSVVFADTFYYLALVNPRDVAHARALEASRKSVRRVVTSAWVIQELSDGPADPPARHGFLRLLSSLQADANTSLVEPDPALWRRGLELYRSRGDKAWSLTDCISFEIMRQHGITEALTADRHFEQAGFTGPCICRLHRLLGRSTATVVVSRPTRHHRYRAVPHTR